MEPATVQTEMELDTNVTDKPEDAVAVKLNGEIPKPTFPGWLKVIVCAA